MKATWEKTGPSTAVFEVEVDNEKIEAAMNQAYHKVVRRVNIPGFRKGKAPRAILERFVGREALLEEALDIVVPEAYNEAVTESGLDPIDQPHLDIVKLEAGEPLVFKAEVAVKPEVELGQYQGFEVERETVEVTPDQIDRQIEMLRERHAQLASVPDDEAVANGLFSLIDFEGFLEGEPFAGGKAEGYMLEVGSGSFIPGFEDQLLGAKIGEEREIQVTFPEEYHAAELAGKPVTFKVKVREIKKKEKPELDDAFAKQAGPFQTLQELQADLQNRLEEAAKGRVSSAFERAAVDKVVAAAKVDLPEILVHRRTHRLMDDFARQLAQSGLSMQDWLQQTGKDDHALHEEFEPAAQQQVKTDLVLEAVAKKEGLTVTEDEVRAEIERLVQSSPGQVEEARRFFASSEGQDQVREVLLLDKAVKHVAGLQKAVPVSKAAAAAEQAAE
ncbi:MAG: trigger factor [Symbiobacteriia bacterium]